MVVELEEVLINVITIKVVVEVVADIKVHVVVAVVAVNFVKDGNDRITYIAMIFNYIIGISSSVFLS
jgi:hypothetical protein